MSPATIPLPPTPPESPHRGRRAVVPAIVLLLVMVAGTAVLVDAVLRARTQAAVAQQVVDQQQGVGVQVRLTGWPFLWQVSRDRLAGASLRADSISVDADGLPVEVLDVDLRATDLVGVRDQQGIVAGRVEGSAAVSWSTLAELSGLDLAYAPPDRVLLRESVRVLGREIPLTVEGRPELDPATGDLAIRDATATVAGATVPQPLVDPVLARVDRGYRLPPLGTLAYRTVEVGPDAVRISLAGADVDIDQLVG